MYNTDLLDSGCHFTFTISTGNMHEPKLESTVLHTKIVDVSRGENYAFALDQEG